MTQYWPSLIHPYYLSFWVREWNKHGSASPLDPLDYFRRTIQLMKGMDLVDTLRGAGLIPSQNGSTYPKSRYKNAISAVTQTTSVILKCYSSVIGDLLEEVMFCTDNAARNFIACNDDDLRADNCGPNVTFLVRQ